MFGIYIGGWQATAQFLGIVLIISAILWLLSKWEVGE